MKHALVTGGAGFIGSNLVDRLLAEAWQVTVIDNFDSFYSPTAKLANIQHHRSDPTFRLVEGDIRDPRAIALLAESHYDVIVHLAALAGVRPSILNPIGYQDVNVAGTQHLLEFARTANIKQFVFASSSSVYGINERVPWSEEDSSLRPISPYASTKLSGELLGHVYSHLYKMRFIALRFFTVYGPRQRPDLAIHRFARNILSGSSIQVYGDGSTRRDYTNVVDIVNGIVAAMAYDDSLFEIMNLGNDQTIELRELIRALETCTGRTAHLEHLPEQPGDVPQTWANIAKAKSLLGYSPAISIQEGLPIFLNWFTRTQEAPLKPNELQMTVSTVAGA